jgi:hypothetical protein
VKFNVLPFMVKIQSLVLIICVWQWFCWRHCFESENFLQGRNLTPMIERRLCLYTNSFFGGLTYREFELQVLFWGCLCCYKNWKTVMGLLLLLYNLLYNVCVCGYRVVTKVECKRYIRDINTVYFFNKNLSAVVF